MSDLIRTAEVTAVEDVHERARAACKVFRSLQPTLSAYARALTGDSNVRVDMASSFNAATDGKRILVRPPLELGDNYRHDRSLCDKRDYNLQLRCKACHVRENLLASIYHEIAHIAFGSFDQTSTDAIRLTVEQAALESGREIDKVNTRIMSAPSDQLKNYMGLASLVNPFMGSLYNAIEDARVDKSMFRERRGTKRMFEADSHRIFEQGVEQKNAEGEIVTIKWSEYKLNAQAMVGVYTKLLDYDYSNWFHEDVVKCLDDPALDEIIFGFEEIDSAEGIYKLSFQVLAHLRRHGFLGAPEDPLPPMESDESEQDPNEDEPQDGEDGTDSNEVSENDGQDRESSNDEGESSGSDEPSSDGEESSSDTAPDDGLDDPDSEESESSAGGGEDSEEDDASDDSGSSEAEESAQSSDDADNDEAEASPSSEGDNSDRDSDNPSDRPAEDGRSDEAELGDESTSTQSSDISAENAEEFVDEASDKDDHPEVGSSGGSDQFGESADREEEDDTESESPNNEDISGEFDSSTGTEDGTSEVEQLDQEDQSVEDEDGNTSGELIDTGADDGYGGTELVGKPDYGTPDEVNSEISVIHPEEKPLSAELSASENSALDAAIIQGVYFTTPSANVMNVREHTYDKHVFAWRQSWGFGSRSKEYVSFAEAWTHKAWADWAGKVVDTSEIKIDESILTSALTDMRIAFSENKRHKSERHRKSGKVDARVLGKRAPLDDPRLFKKKLLPGKRNYLVVLAMDLSGSTMGLNLDIEKRAVMAQAELLARLGVSFAVYGFSGDEAGFENSLGYGDLGLDIYVIKDESERWSSDTIKRLTELGPHGCNLDGHNLEFLRKVCDRSLATDKIIMYYSDGEMPAENEEEELGILQREIATCRNKGYTLMGVGIRTDSPIRHGLDTVQLDEIHDTGKVVKHLQKRLSA